MSKYGWGNASSPESYSSGPSSPPLSTGAGSSGRVGPVGYQPRGFPERIEVSQSIFDRLGPTAEEGAIRALQSKGYIMERPLALVDTLMRDENGGGLFDPIAEGIRNIPVVGEHLDNLGKLGGNLLDESFKAAASVANANLAWGVDNIRGMRDDEAMPLWQEFMAGLSNVGGGLGAFLDPNRKITVGEYKQFLRDREWTDEDFQSVWDGTKGWLDFGEKVWASSHLPKETFGIQNFVGRMVFDPTNLVFMPGTAAKLITRATMGVGRIVGMEASAMRLTAPLTRVAAKGTKEGLAAFAAGKTAGLTTSTMGAALKSMVTGGWKWYRRGAVGTTVGQVAINTLDELGLDDFVHEHAPGLEPIFDLAAALGDNRPLSEGQMFTLASLMYFPSLQMGESYRWLKNKRNEKRLYPHEVKVLEVLKPGKDFATAKSEVIRDFGGDPESYRRFLWQAIRTGYHEQRYLRELGPEALRYDATNLTGRGLEVRFHNRRLEKPLARALETGELTTNDVLRGLYRMGTGRGEVTRKMTKGLVEEFDPEHLIRSWREWEPIAMEFSRRLPNGQPVVPGIAYDVIIKEEIERMIALVDDFAVDGKLSAADMYEIGYYSPGIYQLDAAKDFASIMTRDGLSGTLVAKDVKAALQQIRDEHGILQADYTAPIESWEARARLQEIKARTFNRLLRRDGTIDPGFAPDVGSATMSLMTSSDRRAVKGGLSHVTSYTDNAARIRARSDVMLLEQALPRALTDAGIPVNIATQGQVLMPMGTRNAALHNNTTLVMRLDDAVDHSSAIRSAAWSLRRATGRAGDTSRRVMLIERGADNLVRKGLTPNAREVSFKIGAASKDEWEDIIHYFSEFRNSQVLDTGKVGYVKVVIPDGSLTPKLQRKLEEARTRWDATADSVHYTEIVDAKSIRKSDLPNHTVLVKDVWDDVAKDARFQRASGYHDRYNGLLPGVGEFSDDGGRVGASYRDAPRTGATRYERTHERPVRARDDEFLVSDVGERRALAGVLPDASGNPNFVLRDNDKLFATPGKRNLAVVRADGELILVRTRDAGGNVTGWNVANESVDELLASASEHATWARVPHIPDRSGNSVIERLAEHGWGVHGITISATDPTLAWMLRDVEYRASKEVPHIGGFKAMLDRGDIDIRYHSMPQGRVGTTGVAETMYGERRARELQAERENTYLQQFRRRDQLEEEMRAFRDDLEARRAAGGQPPVPAHMDPQFVGMVSVADLQKVPAGNKLGKTDVSTLAADIAKNGFREPIQLTYSVADNAYIIGEGNHRLAAAIELGLTEVPVTVFRVERGLGQASRKLKKTLADDTGYVPGQFNPGMLGLRAGAKEVAKTPMAYKRYREMAKEFEDLEAKLTKKKAREFHDAYLTETVNPGVVQYVRDAEAELSVFKPYMDESVMEHLDDFSPSELAGLEALERDLRMFNPQYTAKAVPKYGTPYYAEQGEAYRRLLEGRQMAADSWRYRVGDKLQQGLGMMFDPVYSKEQSNLFKQEVYNQFINRGATTREVNAFLRATNMALQDSLSAQGARVFKNIAALPGPQLDAIARHGYGHWEGFSKEFMARMDASSSSISDLLRASNSRTFRNLSRKFPATPGSGNLGKLIEQFYGVSKSPVTKLGVTGDALRRATYGLGLFYHTFRFLADPRWYLLNLFEADFLGAARYGMKVRGLRPLGFYQSLRKSFKLSHDPVKYYPTDPALTKLSGRVRGQDPGLLSLDEIVMADSVSTGWLDTRNLYGYMMKASELERGRITTDALTELMETGRIRKTFEEAIEDGSPVIDDLKRLFGDDPVKWVDDLEEQLYRNDVVGPSHILTDEVAQQMLATQGVYGAAYRDFLEGLQRAHSRSYEDIIHTFHGNVNRSNLERLVNHPLLYWPVSYQLKVGKWLIDIMTKSFMGSRRPLTGSAILYKLVSNHAWAMDNDEEYRKMFQEHPALWQTLGMFLPMTPFDAGVMASRWARYSGSWIGAQLGLWEQDESYPTDPINFVQRSASFGPVYSLSIFQDILEEFEE